MSMNTITQKCVWRIANKLALVICILCLLCIQQAHAVTYYVAKTGSDSNDGTTLSAPLLTITTAISKAVPLDTIYVRAGIYNELVRVNKTDLLISGYENERPVIDGGANLPGVDWGELVGLYRARVTFSGFEVKNSNLNCNFAGGIGVKSNSNNNVIRDVIVYNSCSNGIFVSGDNNLVEDSEVYNNSLVYLKNGGWGAGVSSSDKGDAKVGPTLSTGNILRRLKAHENWGEGISCFNTTYCTIEDSISYNNRAANIYLQNTTFSKALRNLVYITKPHTLSGDVTSQGIVLADERTDVPLSSDNMVIGNCSYNADLAIFDFTLVNSGLINALIAHNTVIDAALAMQYVTAPPPANWFTNIPSNSQVINNLFITDRVDGVKNILSGVTFSNNHYAGSGTTYGKSGTDASGNPLIARTGSTAPGALTWDYCKIQAGSPDINAGVTVANASPDRWGTKRVNPDIGAYEYNTVPTAVKDNITGNTPERQ